MPYIKPKYRKLYDAEIDKIALALQQSKLSGELNYVLSKICAGFLAGRPSYKKLNEVVGVLECAKQELVRKVLSPYEDKKCLENGEVYDV